MICLTKEGSDLTLEEKKKRAERKHLYEDNIVLPWKPTGKVLSPEQFQEFQKIVNVRRPYCREDFIPQTFIPDLSRIR